MLSVLLRSTDSDYPFWYLQTILVKMAVMVVIISLLDIQSLVAWLYPPLWHGFIPPCGMALSSLVAWLYPPLFLLVFCVRVTYRKPVCRVRNVNFPANHRHSHGNKLWSYLCPSFRFKAEFMQKFIKSKSYGKIKPILLICIRPPYWIKMDAIVVLSNERLK